MSREANRPKPTEFKLDLTADLHKWRIFVAISELGSLTRAALFLDSNQSLLSRQISALERECGARLFNRTGRGVELSEMGANLLPLVMSFLSQAERLEQAIRDQAQEPVGRVTLGLLPSIGSVLVGSLFSDVRTRYPAINLKVLEGSSGQIDEWLTDARIDIAILYRYGPSVPELEQSLALVDSYLIGPPGDALTAGETVSFDKMHDLPFILPSAPNGLRAALDTIARQRRINLAPVIEADSLPLQKRLTETERLYTVLALHAVRDEVAAKKLQVARIVDPPLQRRISMAFARSKSPARAVSAVAALTAEIVEKVVHTQPGH